MNKKELIEKLSKISDSIRQYEKDIIDLIASIEELQLMIKLIEVDMKDLVYFDEQYKNAEQRNIAIIKKLQESKEYQDYENEIKVRKNKLKLLEVELKYMYNCFSAFKTIARLMEVE